LNVNIECRNAAFVSKLILPRMDAINSILKAQEH
jgi:hypothetical protein